VPLVLVVDDDPVVRVAVQDLLAVLGHEVACAGSVAEGLALLQDSEQAVLVVLDHDLPDGTGTELALVAALLHPSASVVMHTTRVFAVPPAGVSRVVTKSPGLSALMDVLVPA
jgi:CheY-like chemotaxis protein